MKTYNNLAAFYNGDDWAMCKAQVLNERIREDGVIYCEHCGEPIVKGFNPMANNNKGAIVFHHRIYLTLSNVNDAMISINPENIEIVHWRCHNEIHNRFNGTYAIPEKKIYLITGSPLSGKTSFVRERMQESDLVVDIDDIWQMLSKQDRYKKPDALKPIIFKTRDVIEDSIRLRLGTWRNAFIIKSLPLAMDRRRESEKFGAEVITMDTTKEECLERLIQDPQGRNIDLYKKYIEEYFNKYNI